MEEKKSENIENVGQILKSARKKLGLSQIEIANKLCLKISTVKEIEKNIYSENICFIFIQGYIRSYANMVNLPQDEINKLIYMIKKTSNTPKLSSLKEEILSNKINNKYRPWIFFSLGIVTIFFILIVFIGIWNWGNNIENIQNDLIKLNKQDTILELNSLGQENYQYNKKN